MGFIYRYNCRMSSRRDVYGINQEGTCGILFAIEGNPRMSTREISRRFLTTYGGLLCRGPAERSGGGQLQRIEEGTKIGGRRGRKEDGDSSSFKLIHSVHTATDLVATKKTLNHSQVEGLPDNE